MILRALIEEWPDVFSIYVHELPGVVVGANSFVGALEILPDAIEAHLNWLASHGYDVRPFAGADVEIAEQTTAIEGRRGPLFEADRIILSSDDVEHTLRIAALARRDLVDLYRSISEFRRERAPVPGDWSIADHLRHIAEAEVYYAENLRERASVQLPHDPLAAMSASAAHADGILRSLDEDQRGQTFSHNGEEWTATKVLRRLTGHLREHYRWVRELAHS